MFHVGFGDVKPLAIRNTHFEAVPALRAHGCPCGLQDSLCTLHLLCSPAQHLWLRRRCNTRYGWVVSPFPTGTFTRQDAPSLSWRDNVTVHPAEERGAAPLPRGGGNGLFGVIFLLPFVQFC